MGLSKEKLALLRHLRRDSRKSLSAISREEKIPLQGLIRSLRCLERGVIIRHYSVLDLARLGYNLRVHLILGARDNEGLRACIMESKSVNSVLRISGNLFYLECFFRDLKELYQFKEEVSRFELVSLQEHFVIEEVKREEFVLEKR